MQDYKEFLLSKSIRPKLAGFAPSLPFNSNLFAWQQDILRVALQRGRCAMFEDCGLGKSIQQLEWARQVCHEASGNVLIPAPLAVAQQTYREGQKFGIEVTLCRTQADVGPGINVTNYEMLENFDARQFVGVALDEGSILKNAAGVLCNRITEMFALTPYRTTWSATPAPNDHIELGTQAEFLGIMKREEMLATFFTHDGGDTSKWRLMGHAEDKFWAWVASWAIMVRKPSDLGYPDAGFALPPLEPHPHVTRDGEPDAGRLFAVEAQSLTERRAARRHSLSDRVEIAASLANNSNEPFLLWCDLNDEADAVTAAIPGAVQVAGRHSNEEKEAAMLGFADGSIRVLVSKPSICGFGMNFQHCNNVVFVGLSDSYEKFYQAIRRCWRFGQTRPVQCHIITSEREGAVVANIQRKEQLAQTMGDELMRHMQNAINDEVATPAVLSYLREVRQGEDWTVHLGDCVEVVAEMESNSIDYSIFSPPFASLYTYSNSERDMGNCRNKTEFYQHFEYLARDLYRVLKPGRNLSFHCFDIPAMKERDGFIGLFDFPADLRAIFERCGFIYHSKHVIWKDPVVAMQRTKALGLLHKQVVKDSSMSRAGLPDYLITMRKPGVNQEPIAGDFTEYSGDDDFMHSHDMTRLSIDIWQRYASPVWMDINPSKTLQRESAREERDERHICPLQLQVIERGLQLWTNPGDLVLDPFAGIGSTGYVALKQNRRFVGIELKRSYFNQACRNLEAAVIARQQLQLLEVA